MFSAIQQVITPERARDMLQLNLRNRKLRPRHVANLARAMKAGQWVMNGQGIILDREGLVLDGQHRLEAVALANVPVKMLVIRGVDKEAFTTIDSGESRKFHDVLTIGHADRPSVLARAATALWKYYEGDLMNNNLKPSNAELDEFLSQHPGLADSVAYVCCEKDPARIISKSVASFLHYVFSLDDADAADIFISRLIDGLNIEHDSPIGLLRNKLISAKAKRDRLHTREVFALCFKAWKLYRKGATVSRLVLGPKHREYVTAA